MRLTRKLILALTFATLLILGVGAFLQVQREVMLFDQLGRRNDAFVGRLLARAVGDAWKAGGEPAAAAIVRDADLTGTHLHVRWVWLDSAVRRRPPACAMGCRARRSVPLARARCGPCRSG